jgi:predicted lipoprotein with Yx(FWY)xxD motif
MGSRLKTGYRLFGVTIVVAATMLSACGSRSVSSDGPTSVAASKASTPSRAAPLVSTASVPGVGSVLVDSNGFTLYYLKTDAGGSTTCMGTCAAAWPPLLLAAGASSPTGGAGVTGQLGTIQRPDGTTQVTYDGWPLYGFVKDQPGQATGQGVSDFFVVTPSGPASGPSSSGGTGPGY